MHTDEFMRTWIKNGQATKELSTALDLTQPYLNKYNIKYLLPNEIGYDPFTIRTGTSSFDLDENIIRLTQWHHLVYLHELGHALDFNINKCEFGGIEDRIYKEQVASVVAHKLCKKLQLPRDRILNECYVGYRNFYGRNEYPLRTKNRIRNILQCI